MKQLILGTILGRIAGSFRNDIELLRSAFLHAESIGTLANDQMATELVTKICKSNKTFIDVGAHIGSIVTSVMHNDGSINIVAIEAIPEKVSRLRKKFPRVTFHECAVGNTEGEVSFFINTRQSGYSSLGRPKDGFSNQSTIEIKVPIKKLDSLITTKEVDVIKIDVEGAELGVIRGSKNIIAGCRPVIMFESGSIDNEGLGYTKEALWEIFAEQNYSIIVPNRVAHNDPGLSKEGFLESHLYPRRTTNYFAIPKERRLEIRDRARFVLNISVN